MPGPPERQLATGAEMRITGPTTDMAVVCVNGGQATEVEGTWSATLEWLVRRLARRFPRLGFAEVKYRIKSWRRLELCVEDARAAVAGVGAPRILLVGFSMGGAVAVQAADAPAVEGVVGLAPWIPDRVPLDAMSGRRLAVIHGGLDRGLPGTPGVSPDSSRRAFERAVAAGIEASYTLIPGGIHGVAVRAHRGRPIPLPRARRWVELVSAELARFEAEGTR